MHLQFHNITSRILSPLTPAPSLRLLTSGYSLQYILVTLLTRSHRSVPIAQSFHSVPLLRHFAHSLRALAYYDTIHAIQTVTSTPPYPFSFHKSKLLIPSRRLSHHAPCAINTPLPPAFCGPGLEVSSVVVDCINVAVMNHFICGWVCFKEVRRVV
jgi:hypothetical protein